MEAREKAEKMCSALCRSSRRRFGIAQVKQRAVRRVWLDSQVSGGGLSILRTYLIHSGSVKRPIFCGRPE